MMSWLTASHSAHGSRNDSNAPRVPRDVQEFLDDYPHLETAENLDAVDNLEFYQGRLRCRPDERTIDEIHERWFGQYNKLERKHGYIQWLFPIREYGMNYESQPLQKHEREEMRRDQQVVERVKRSYEMMLDFYGMTVQDWELGKVGRKRVNGGQAPDAAPMADGAEGVQVQDDLEVVGGWKERYRNLVYSMHNNLRISRILKCLSEMGLEHLNAGFLLHVLNEQSEFGELNSRGIRGSMDAWWGNCLRNEEERNFVQGMIARVRQEAGYIFTREEYVRLLERRKETGRLSEAQTDNEESENESDSTDGKETETK